MISFVKLVSDAGSGQTEIFATFAPVVKSIEFVDVASGAETRPGMYQPGQDREVEDILEPVVTRAARTEIT